MKSGIRLASTVMVSLSFSGEVGPRAAFVGVLVEVDIVDMLMLRSEGSALVEAGIDMGLKGGVREHARLI